MSPYEVFNRENFPIMLYIQYCTKVPCPLCNEVTETLLNSNAPLIFWDRTPVREYEYCTKEEGTLLVISKLFLFVCV
jgi:hypothetical protein